MIPYKITNPTIRPIGNELEIFFVPKVRDSGIEKESVDFVELFKDCIPREVTFPNLYQSAHANVLTNGARFYVDTGGGIHYLEYATPEAASVRELLALEVERDYFLIEFFNRVARLYDKRGIEIVASKDNIGSSNTGTRGFHDNYLIDSQLFQRIKDADPSIKRTIVPFMIASIFFSGNGQVNTSNGHKLSYLFSSRATIMDKVYSDSTVLGRGIVNLRSESLMTDPQKSRLHIIFHDSPSLEAGSFLRIGTFEILLSALEKGYAYSDYLPFSNQAISDSEFLIVLKCLNSDTSLRAKISLGGKWFSILDLQEIYFDFLLNFCLRENVMTKEREAIFLLWRHVLNIAREPNFYEELSPFFGWALKRVILERDMKRYGCSFRDLPNRKIRIKGSRNEISLFTRLKFIEFSCMGYYPLGLFFRNPNSYRILNRENYFARTGHFKAPTLRTRAYARFKQLEQIRKESLDYEFGCRLEVSWQTVVAQMQNGVFLHEFINNSVFDTNPKI